MATQQENYPARLKIDYPSTLDRFTTFFRLLWAIPILVIITLLSATNTESYINEAGKSVSTNSGGIAFGLFAATALMIVFRQHYPRWWFDFNLEFNRFSTRIFAYLFLLTDKYPSTTDKQTVHLEIDYPDVEKDLNRYLPLVKWFLAIPHYFVLAFLVFAALLATVVAWFAILFTGKYPKDLFDFVVGVARWGLRVSAYAFFLTTDDYPPFSLD